MLQLNDRSSIRVSIVRTQSTAHTRFLKNNHAVPKANSAIHSRYLTENWKPKTVNRKRLIKVPIKLFILFLCATDVEHGAHEVFEFDFSFHNFFADE